MPTHLLCSNGHEWKAEETLGPCPICGAAVLNSASPAFHQAETLPPPRPVAHAADATVAPDVNPQALTLGEEPPAAAWASGAIPAELARHSRYRILEQLGQGGMGAVYKAEHLLMERTVALKVINHALTGNEAAVKRFKREVTAVARLSHPNIVTAFDADHVGDTHFLVMEFVKGQSLDRVIAGRGQLPVTEACDYLCQAAAGLEHAYEHGHVHRDIKPQNLMITPEGQVKILDFGLARLATETRTEVPMPAEDAPAALRGGHSLAGFLTHAGVVMGTPDYIAPEQVTDARTADIRADIYSLGCTFYHMLTGQVPFTGGGTFDKLLAHQERAPRPLTEFRQDVPPDVDRILRTMLAKSADERYQTPGELLDDLEELSHRGFRIPSLARHTGIRTIPNVLPAAPEVASVPPTSIIEAPRANPGKQPSQARRSWCGVLLGCSILTILTVGGITLCIAWMVGFVSDKVKEVAPFFQDRSARQALWHIAEEGWTPPPPGLEADKLFPIRVDRFSRVHFEQDAGIRELGIELTGAHARYESFEGAADVYIFAASKEVADEAMAAALAKLKNDNTGHGYRGEEDGKSKRTLIYSLGGHTTQYVLWWYRDHLLVAAGRKGFDPETLLINLVREMSQKGTAPQPPAPNRPPPIPS